MTNFKEPAWFINLIDQRLALIEHALGGRTSGYAIIVNPLTEPPESATPEEREKWERTCDRCGKYTPPHVLKFHSGTRMTELRDGTQVVIMFGFCSDCLADFKED